MKRARVFYLCLTLAVVLAAGCRQDLVPGEAQPAGQQLKVYTSIYPLYDFTKRIGGPGINVINITPPGAEPHSFQPSARLVAELARSRIFIYNGAGMEPYLEKLKQAVQGNAPLMVNASQGLDLLENDPHTWLSPINAENQGKTILEALILVDPANKKAYEANYEVFRKELQTLEQEYREALSKCKKNQIIVSHAAFAYLARDFGLVQIPVMGLSAEAEPTPGKLRELIELAKTNGISCIFFESLASPKVSETIAREINARTLVLHPLGSLTEKEIRSGEDYFSIMRKNLENLKTALEYAP
ncbi:MAG: zinc ABC transporter substrate-binding protein [Peptococcaceae bacterium]|jgi:zinc transport system substrate-binding protein|nr:zinc ABC transporter substrate-binding protein [Peptococcaceae bacterium]MDH7524623.1 zinc ABC transporter substrate-binding protein [Peptococcaceae bacterium]